MLSGSVTGARPLAKRKADSEHILRVRALQQERHAENKAAQDKRLENQLGTTIIHKQPPPSVKFQPAARAARAAGSGAPGRPSRPTAIAEPAKAQVMSIEERRAERKARREAPSVPAIVPADPPALVTKAPAATLKKAASAKNVPISLALEGVGKWRNPDEAKNLNAITFSFDENQETNIRRCLFTLAALPAFAAKDTVLTYIIKGTFENEPNATPTSPLFVHVPIALHMHSSYTEDVEVDASDDEDAEDFEDPDNFDADNEPRVVEVPDNEPRVVEIIPKKKIVQQTREKVTVQNVEGCVTMDTKGVIKLGLYRDCQQVAFPATQQGMSAVYWSLPYGITLSYVRPCK